jgi:hypothetical protein
MLLPPFEFGVEEGGQDIFPQDKKDRDEEDQIDKKGLAEPKNQSEALINEHAEHQVCRSQGDVGEETPFFHIKDSPGQDQETDPKEDDGGNVKGAHGAMDHWGEIDAQDFQDILPLTPLIHRVKEKPARDVDHR